VAPAWSFLPLVFFLGLLLVAPFVQRMEFFLPIVMTGKGESGTVALTFDDGPDPITTPRLLDLLAHHRVKATFFLVGRKVADCPDLVKRILAEGHEIGNHSGSHDVFLMLRSRQRLAREIERCQEALAPSGIRPLAFRPPVGITNPRLGPALDRSGLYCVGFSRRPRDWGNRRVTGISQRILARVKQGDIILLHDRACQRRKDVEVWLQETDALIRGLKGMGMKIGRLSRLIDRPVMESIAKEPSETAETGSSVA
jgi:peptidoglycan/xylan/chitin deacetylase (PgdA/CDA1 family)